jgi:hypothetical protein
MDRGHRTSEQWALKTATAAAMNRADCGGTMDDHGGLRHQFITDGME